MCMCVFSDVLTPWGLDIPRENGPSSAGCHANQPIQPPPLPGSYIQGHSSPALTTSGPDARQLPQPPFLPYLNNNKTATPGIPSFKEAPPKCHIPRKGRAEEVSLSLECRAPVPVWVTWTLSCRHQRTSATSWAKGKLSWRKMDLLWAAVHVVEAGRPVRRLE